MKKIPIIITLLGFLLSCSQGEDANLDLENNPNAEIIGKWQLIEQLMDPGDGSGVFRPIASDHTIEFFNDGTFKSTKSLCYAGGGVNQGSTGKIEPDRKVLILDGCWQDESLPKFELTYDLQQQNLIINLPCIEPCALKFEKVE